jgi:tetratricopeptide (TPR) repeat protein
MWFDYSGMHGSRCEMRVVAEMDESIVQRAMESKDPLAGEQALREYDVAIQRSSESMEKAKLLLGKAVLCGVFSWFKQSRDALEDAWALTPDNLDMQLEVDFIDGTLYDQETKPEEAYVRLTSVLSRYSRRLSVPDVRFMYQDIQLRRGFDSTSTGRFTEALPILKECLSFNLKPTQRSMVLADLGRCYSEAGEYESVRDSFVQAIRIGLTNRSSEGQAHLYLAMAYARLGLFEAARDEFKLCEARAIEYGLQVSNLYRWLASVCNALGEQSESERYAMLGARPC